MRKSVGVMNISCEMQPKPSDDDSQMTLEHLSNGLLHPAHLAPPRSPRSVSPPRSVALPSQLGGTRLGKGSGEILLGCWMKERAWMKGND